MRARRVVRAASLAGALGVILTACSSDPPPAATIESQCPHVVGPLVIATGRANSPAVSTSAIGSESNLAAADGSAISVIDTGGDPTVLATVDFKRTAGNEMAAKADSETRGRVLADALENVAPTQPEANPLKALTVAARQIHGSATNGTVILADSGVQTVDPLDYRTEGLAFADPQEVAARLKADGELPDLTGVTVHFVGLGDTAPPQEEPSTAGRTNLQEQWKAIALAAGAACVAVEPQPLSGDAPLSEPSVAVVALPSPVTPTLTPTPEAEIKFTADTIAFKSESSELVDPTAAKKALADVAKQLVDNPRQVTLTGTTATFGPEAGRIELSQERADAVKDLLVDMGVSAGNITTVGVGTNHPKHVPDTDANGQLDPAAAAQNRAVFLTVD